MKDESELLKDGCSKEKANNSRSILLKYIDKELKDSKSTQIFPQKQQTNKIQEFKIEFKETFSSSQKNDKTMKRIKMDTMNTVNTQSSTNEFLDKKKINESLRSSVVSDSSDNKEFQEQNYIYLKNYLDTLKLNHSQKRRDKAVFHTYTYRELDKIANEFIRTFKKKKTAY